MGRTCFKPAPVGPLLCSHIEAAQGQALFVEVKFLVRGNQMKTVSAQKVYQAYDQKANGKGGKFGTLNPCYCCGKSAGSNYYSHPLTDMKSPNGDSWGDLALCLCKKCCIATEKIVEPVEFIEYRKYVVGR